MEPEIIIYHNPACSKSRAGLNFLEEKKLNYEVRKYMKEMLSFGELKLIVQQLKIPPISLVRKNEKIWKENYQHLSLTDDQIISLLVEHPQLIERPIVSNGKMAVVARPVEEIEKII